MRHRPTRQPVLVDETAPVAPAHRPTRWNVGTVRLVAFALVWAAVALALLATLVAYRTAEASARQAEQTDRRLSALEDYVAGKGAQRDRENARLREEIRQTTCDVLDQLPQSPLLDGPRQKYGCGPGLPPALAEPSSAPTSAPAAPSSAAGRRVTPKPEEPSATRARPTPSAPTTTPSKTGGASPSATPPPAPTTADPLLCRLLTICIESP